MDVPDWVALRRQDGETVGYLQPLDPGFDAVQARSVLGHAIGGPLDYMRAEELLLERGIGELAGYWQLAAAPGRLSILEVSVHGIVVADALATEALVPCGRCIVPWPDVDGLLGPSADR